MQDKWWKKSVVYQVYPRSFMDSNGDGIGDLGGITMKLPYLAYLGIDVIWLSPIYKSPNDDNGYDISDYQAIMDEFGNMADFQELLKTAHDLGLKIMLDLVVNHTSDEHPWFIESKKDQDNPYRNYYIWKEGDKTISPNNWGSSFGGSAWQYDETTSSHYLHLYSVKQPDLNWDYEPVREEIYKMMTWWLDMGIDGFRMDVINLIGKDPSFPDAPTHGHQYGNFYPIVANNPKVHTFLKEMHEKVLGHYDLITVGEMPEANVSEARKYTDPTRKELDMIFHFEHMACDSGKYGRWSDQRVYLPELKAVMSKWQEGLRDKGWNSLYWNNHDQPRIVSRFGDEGKYRVESAKMLATCLHFMQGTPYIYQGEELGMTNIKMALSEYKDIDTINSYHQLVTSEGVAHQEMMTYIHRKSRDNARTPMQWSEAANGGFSYAEPWIKVNPNHTFINVASQIEDPNSVMQYYRRLIRLRKEKSIIVEGTYRLLEPDHEDLYVYMRTCENQELLVICNFKDKEVSMELPEKFRSNSDVLIHNYDQELSIDDMGGLVLRPYEALVMERYC